MVVKVSILEKKWRMKPPSTLPIPAVDNRALNEAPPNIYLSIALQS